MREALYRLDAVDELWSSPPAANDNRGLRTCHCGAHEYSVQHAASEIQPVAAYALHRAPQAG